MTIDCSPNWSEVTDTMGPCIRPGGVLLTARALEICSLPSGSRVVDIGCGVGGTLEHLEHTGLYHAVGLDYSDALLGEAGPRLLSARLVRGRAETLPFKDGSFDALFCECVLSILSNRMSALHEFARVLKHGGYLIISDLFLRSGPVPIHVEAGLQEGLPTKEDLFNVLAGHGFALLLWEEHEGFLKEFAARMILAGERLPDAWGCRPGQGRKKTVRPSISYFLLVARKNAVPFYETTQNAPPCGRG